MFRPVPLVLILVVMLTSVGLGAARGTVRQGNEVVLCTGHGVVVTVLPGDQGRTAHLCPDMALAMLAAIGAPDVVLPQRILVARAAPLTRRSHVGGVQRITIRVRDPPAVLVA